MEGKWVILIVLIATIAGIALAYIFLQTLPNNIKEQSLSIETISPVNEWLKTSWYLR